MFSWETLKSELRELRGAKWSLLVIVLATAVGVWFGAGQFYSERIETLTTQRDGYKDQLDRLVPVPPVFSVELNCEPQLMPAAPTFNERLDVYQIDRSDQGGRMLAGIWGNQAESGLPKAMRCDVINRGNVPVANVWIDIDVVFKAVERTPGGGGGGSGDIVGSHQRTFIVPGVVEVGGQPQTFWITNNTDLYVFAAIRERIMVSAPDGRGLMFNAVKRGSAIDLQPRER